MKVMRNDEEFLKEMELLIEPAKRLVLTEVTALFPLPLFHPFHNGTKAEMKTDKGSDSSKLLWDKIVSFVSQNNLEMVIYPDQNFFELEKGAIHNDLFNYKKIGFYLKP